MFTKFKQAIENWLRAIVADEVSKVDIELHLERVALASTIGKCQAAVERLNEISYYKENAELRAHIRDLESKIVSVVDAYKKLNPKFQ
jgi:hypothetical protein